MYNTYEEYMQNVLGVKMPNTYAQNANYYGQRMSNIALEEINVLYPEIYSKIYPSIQRICSRRNIGNINKGLVEEIVEEVYENVESSENKNQVTEASAPLRNRRCKKPESKRTCSKTY